MAQQNEIIYSDQGRMAGTVLCGADLWARDGQADPELTAWGHNNERHSGSLLVRRVESEDAS
jgi:hypothetical protein